MARRSSRRLSSAFLKLYDRQISDQLTKHGRLQIRRVGARKPLVDILNELPLALAPGSDAVLRIPEPHAEYRFHATRRWRFDYAWPSHKLALEVQGGIFTEGRHTRGGALLKEHEKLNAAAIDGWRVLFTTPRDVRNGTATKLIAQAIAQEDYRDE